VDYINRMLGTADSYLSDPDVPLSTDGVVHDSFDALVYDELLDEAPALAELVSNIAWKWSYARDCIRDVLMLFWQADPRVRTAEEMDPRFLQNRAVAADIESAPETPLTRTMTRHDRYGAAMATLAVAKKIEQALERFKKAQEAADEAARQREELRDKMKELAQKLAELLQALAPMMMIPGDPDCDGMSIPMVTGIPLLDDDGNPVPGSENEPVPAMNGPLTEDQQAAVDALQELLDEIGQDVEAAAKALQEAYDEARKTEIAMRSPINDAVQEAGDSLREEQELFSSWGKDPGEIKKLSFEERAALAKKLRNSRLSKYADLLGRFRIMVSSLRVRKTQYGRDEVIGTELSGELDRVLGSELARSRHPALRLDFLQRFEEDQLLSRKYQGIEKLGKGAIIAAIDNSGSMTYTDKGGISREAWAKAFSLALLDYCRQERRDFVGINFSSSSQQKVWHFPKGQGDISKVLEFVEHFFNGGTDYEHPLDLATNILEKEFNENGRPKGDIIFITDDDCRVSPDWLHRFKERQHNLDFRVWGIAVGTHAGNALKAISNNVRSITEFVDPMSVSDIIKALD
jgi:uncharacterized protein with von Willebrand factor type A (vWA) domain